LRDLTVIPACVIGLYRLWVVVLVLWVAAVIGFFVFVAPPLNAGTGVTRKHSARRDDHAGW
jgi:uncharacterized membrane protein